MWEIYTMEGGKKKVLDKVKGDYWEAHERAAWLAFQTGRIVMAGRKQTLWERLKGRLKRNGGG